MKTTQELLELLDATEDRVARPESDQERFFKTLGIVHDEKGRVGADILYYTYLKWKEDLGEIDVVDRHLFFRKTHGFPGWVRKTVDSGQTKYWLPKELFPVDINVRLEMRKIWREEKLFLQRSRAIKKGIKQRRRDLRKDSSLKSNKSTTT